MNFSEIAVMTGETLLTTLLCTALAYLAGLPCGVLLCVTSKNGIAPRRVPHFLLSAVVNLLRSVPCLILIVLCMPVTRVWFGKGTGEWYTVLLPLTLSAFGFVARMAEQSLSEVPAGEIEAVKSLGATNFQLIVKVLLPEAVDDIGRGGNVGNRARLHVVRLQRRRGRTHCGHLHVLQSQHGQLRSAGRVLAAGISGGNPRFPVAGSGLKNRKKIR